MMKNDHIAEKIENTIENIDKVGVSPFFKNKVLHRLYEEQEPQYVLSSWLTPKVQLAALAIFIAVNLAVFFKMNEQQYATEVDSFAAAYELTAESDEILFE